MTQKMADKVKYGQINVVRGKMFKTKCWNYFDVMGIDNFRAYTIKII